MASAKLDKVLKRIMAEENCTRMDAYSLIQPEDGIDLNELYQSRYDEAQASRAKLQQDVSVAQAKIDARLQEAWDLGIMLD